MQIIIIYSKNIKKDFSIETADCIIHFDQPWNPLIKKLTEQNIFTGIRKKTAFTKVFNYMVSDTIDERILIFLYNKGFFNKENIALMTPARLSQMITTEEWFYILGVDI